MTAIHIIHIALVFQAPDTAVSSVVSSSSKSAASVLQSLLGTTQLPALPNQQPSVSVASHAVASNTATTPSITSPVPAPAPTATTTKTSRFLVTKSTLPVDISSSATLPSLSSNLQEHTVSTNSTFSSPIFLIFDE